MQKGRLPLEGIRVIDVGWYGVGPITTKYLGHFGAEVIRVESTTRPDRLRQPPALYSPKGGKPGPNISPSFNDYNTDKMGICLNLKTPQGLEALRQLVRVSDVVADNWAGDAMLRTGLGHEDLARIKPDIISISIPVFGGSGPQMGYRGHGMNVEAAGGLDAITGFPGWPPVGTCMYYPDFGSNPFHAIFAIMAAIHYRNRTGWGQHIEEPQIQATVAVLETTVLDYTVNGRIAGPPGNRLPYAAPHGAYRCKGEDRCVTCFSLEGPYEGRKDDRWCVIAVFTDEEWKTFCHVMGDPSWTQDPKFATHQARKENEDELDQHIEEWTRQHTADEVMLLMQRAGVAAGVCQDIEDLIVRCPQLAARGYWAYLDHPEAGHRCHNGVAEKLSLTAGYIQHPAPCLGQHTEHILKQYLGYDDEQIHNLASAGALS